VPSRPLLMSTQGGLSSVAGALGSQCKSVGSKHGFLTRTAGM